MDTLARSAAGVDAAEDLSGLLYGALIAASVLATASAHIADFPHVALATGFVLAVYWLAHVYTTAQALHVEGDRRSFLRRLLHMAVHTSDILKGGVPAIAVYVAVDVLGAETRDAAAAAVYFSVAMLVFVGYLTARRSGRRGWATVADAVTAGLFGVVVIIAKALLH